MLVEIELVVLWTVGTSLQLVDVAEDAKEAVGRAPVVVYCVEDIVCVEVDVTVVLYARDGPENFIVVEVEGDKNVAEDDTVVEVQDEAESFAEEASCVYVAFAQLSKEAKAHKARMIDAPMLS